MKWLCALLCLFATLQSSAESARTVWRWVDANGVTHFSDTPQPGAARVELQGIAPAAATPAAASQAAAVTRSPTPVERVQYESLEIWQPDGGASFFGTDASVPVGLRLTPSLARGDTVSLYLNGRRIEDFPELGLDYLLTGVERGAHTLTAAVADADGNILVRSEPRVFHLRQNSIQNQKNPQNRPPRPTPR